MTVESKAAFARRLGINKSNITRAAQAGRLVLTPTGEVEVEASLARWQQTQGGRGDVAARHAANRGADVSMGHPNAENGATAPSPPPQRPSAAPGAGATDAATDPAPVSGAGRARYKAMALHYENQTIKLGLALRRGLRYQLADVRRESSGLGATVRASIERIIDQTAPRLAVMSNDIDRRRLIRAELRRLRWMVKTELPRSLRRLRQAGSTT